jgi:SPP1 gp7 family putative phage head morphogenesis protein
LIPELDPSELDPDNTIPEDLTAIIVTAIQLFENKRKDSLIAGAAKNYLTGIVEAYKQVNTKFKTSQFKDEVQEFLKVYKSQLQEGYTIIQGKKVFWLRDRTIAERQLLFDTISTGLNKGNSPADIAKELKKYVDLSKSHAELISRTETAYVQGNARENSYKNLGVKKVKWLLGANPCPECVSLGNQIYNLDELPYSIPRHPRCTCALSPVLD